MTDRLEALGSSVDRLRTVVDGLDAAHLTDSAYPSGWTIADVLSHLGSGAEILLGSLEDSLAGTPSPDGAAKVVWDEWNAKAPVEQAADALAADRAMPDRIDGLSDDECTRFRFAMGPMEFDLDGFVGLRLNEHALHLWDIEVALDPSATIAPGSVAAVVDNLGLITRFTAKPVGEARSVTVATTGPQRSLVLALGPDQVELSAADPSAAVDLVLPAEAFVRLVHGRLDPDHTPPVEGIVDPDELRSVFPGA